MYHCPDAPDWDSSHSNGGGIGLTAEQQAKLFQDFHPDRLCPSNAPLGGPRTDTRGNAREGEV